MATYVYVSAAEDGDIGCYALRADGTLEPRGRCPAEKGVMPMSVRPDQRVLVAAARNAPYQAHSFAIDRRSGALAPLGSGPLAESFPYITFDRTGRWLLAASYSAHLVSVNPVGRNGVVGKPKQVMPTGRHAHAIIVERKNRFAFVPHLGTDQVFQFRFDAKRGTLAASTPPLLQLKQGLGPRHLRTAPDNRFVYVLNELTATVSSLALNSKTGILTEVSSTSALPADSKLVPGAPRPQPGRDVSNDIWASDLHLTPNGRFLYAAERTSSTLGAFSVDARSGKLTYLGSTPTEKQPRGFRIDPAGRTLIASGEKSDMLASYAIEANGALRPVGRFPAGRGSNWVEIVAFG